MAHEVDPAGSFSDTDVESPPPVRNSAMKRAHQAGGTPSGNESEQLGRPESQIRENRCVRVRRRLAELPNRVACLLCPKSYGSDTAMLHHMRLKHSLSAAAARQSFLARKIKENYGKPHSVAGTPIVVDDKHLVAQHISMQPITSSGTLEPPNERGAGWARANQLSPPAHHHPYATPTHPFAVPSVRTSSNGHSPDSTWTPRVPYSHSPHHNEPSAVYRSVSGDSIGYVPRTPDDYGGYSSFAFATGPAIPYPENSSSSGQTISWPAHQQTDASPYAQGGKFAPCEQTPPPHVAHIASFPNERKDTHVEVKRTGSETTGGREDRAGSATPESGHGNSVETTSTHTAKSVVDEGKKARVFTSRFSIASLLACEGP
eukprot:comp17444_c0_seq1/m.16863 comp17444_c0_seq1/g.16863  ORF comp17444_c0_seq1/g.16863 comp17444_c0_seq1/m.16863 type:complete len:374 (-) comp17444_c0_seq1:699-1820(-)